MQKEAPESPLQELTSRAQEIGLRMYKIQMHYSKVTSKQEGCQISEKISVNQPGYRLGGSFRRWRR